MTDSEPSERVQGWSPDSRVPQKVRLIPISYSLITPPSFSQQTLTPYAASFPGPLAFHTILTRTWEKSNLNFWTFDNFFQCSTFKSIPLVHPVLTCFRVVDSYLTKTPRYLNFIQTLCYDIYLTTWDLALTTCRMLNQSCVLFSVRSLNQASTVATRYDKKQESPQDLGHLQTVTHLRRLLLHMQNNGANNSNNCPPSEVVKVLGLSCSIANGDHLSGNLGYHKKWRHTLVRFLAKKHIFHVRLRILTRRCMIRLLYRRIARITIVYSIFRRIQMLPWPTVADRSTFNVLFNVQRSTFSQRSASGQRDSTARIVQS